jgi:hypothetical protein
MLGYASWWKTTGCARKAPPRKWAEESPPGDRGKYAHGNSRLIGAMAGARWFGNGNALVPAGSPQMGKRKRINERALDGFFRFIEEA